MPLLRSEWHRRIDNYFLGFSMLVEKKEKNSDSSVSPYKMPVKKKKGISPEKIIAMDNVVPQLLID